MKFSHVLILSLIAIITLVVLFAIYNPTLLEDTWLWLIGLSGTIIAYFRELYKTIKRFILKIITDGNKK